MCWNDIAPFSDKHTPRQGLPVYCVVRVSVPLSNLFSRKMAKLQHTWCKHIGCLDHGLPRARVCISDNTLGPMFAFENIHSVRSPNGHTASI